MGRTLGTVTRNNGGWYCCPGEKDECFKRCPVVMTSFCPSMDSGVYKWMIETNGPLSTGRASLRNSVFERMWWGWGGEVISLLLEYCIWSRLRPLCWSAYRQLAMWSMGKKLGPREPILRILTKVTSEHRQEGTTLGWAFLCQLVTNKMTYRHVQMPNWWGQFLN